LQKLEEQEGENWYLDLETKIVKDEHGCDRFVVNCACMVSGSEPVVVKAYAGNEAMDDMLDFIFFF